MTKSGAEVSCGNHNPPRQLEQERLQSQQNRDASSEQTGLLYDDVNYNHQCYICDKTFSANSNLNRHLRKIHQETVQSPYNNVKCALCDSQYPSSSLYIKHLEREHQVSIQMTQLKFDTQEDFEEWKHEIENQTTSQFIKSRGQKRSKNINKTYYSCNRSGYFISKAKTQKALKKQGSRKINGRCPASINVTIDEDGSYKVRFISTHVGHDPELKHLDLSEKDRDLILEKLVSGITKRDIIRQIRTTADLKNTFIAATNDDLTTTPNSALVSSFNSLQPIVISSRSSIPGCGDQQIEVVLPGVSDVSTSTDDKSADTLNFTACSAKVAGRHAIPPKTYGINERTRRQISRSSASSRLHLATTKDIHNILNSKHLDSKKIRHNYDLNTLEQWINDMNEFREMSSTVLFYKDQGQANSRFAQLCQDDFVLVLMKDGQASALRKWANKCVVIDSTHDVNCEYLHLTYMSVIDDSNKCFPVAFMFSTRTNLQTLEVFYTLIRDKVGQVSTRALVADEPSDFYEAWFQVMSKPLHSLLAPWSVLKSWSAKYNLIKNVEKSRKLKRQLRDLLTETDSEKFNRSLKRIMSDFRRDPDTSEFMAFFEKQFAKKPDVWSGCFHTSLIESNLLLLRAHERFMKVYKEGKTSKKMCKYISCLMQLFEDHQLKEMLREEQRDQVANRKALLNRHNKGISAAQSVYEVAVEPVYWLCPSDCPTDVYDEVRRNLEYSKVINRKCCESMCSECKACRHQYMCTCLDYVVNLKMCKHIHRINTLCHQE